MTMLAKESITEASRNGWPSESSGRVRNSEGYGGPHQGSRANSFHKLPHCCAALQCVFCSGHSELDKMRVITFLRWGGHDETERQKNSTKCQNGDVQLNPVNPRHHQHMLHFKMYISSKLDSLVPRRHDRSPYLQVLASHPLRYQLPNFKNTILLHRCHNPYNLHPI